MLGFAALAAASVTVFSSLVAPSSAAASPALPSFASVDTLFSFGDSYSTVGYKPQDGLLPLPGVGGTTSGGYNWVQYLAFMQNASYFDFAQSAATVNNSIIHNNRGETPPSFDIQLATFEEYFAGGEPEIPWTSDKSLFTVFFGINDIGFTVLQDSHNASEIVPRIVESYETSVSQLYARGARQFLLLLMPPTYRTPYIKSFGAETVAKFNSTIDLYVSTLTTAVADLTTRYPDATFVTYDTAPMFNSILDDAAAHGFSISSTSCWAYWNKHDPDLDLPSCEAPLADYVWMDDYHPTWGVHALVAEDIAKTLTGTVPSIIASPPDGRTISRRAAQPARKAFRRRRPGHGSARGSGAGAHDEAAHALMRERMRRSWAGLAMVDEA
ncbi:hypothetical protein JCM8208_004871 [Rhodotorula glutinis]